MNTLLHWYLLQFHHLHFQRNSPLCNQRLLLGGSSQYPLIPHNRLSTHLLNSKRPHWLQMRSSLFMFPLTCPSWKSYRFAMLLQDKVSQPDKLPRPSIHEQNQPRRSQAVSIFILHMKVLLGLKYLLLYLLWQLKISQQNKEHRPLILKEIQSWHSQKVSIFRLHLKVLLVLKYLLLYLLLQAKFSQPDKVLCPPIFIQKQPRHSLEVGILLQHRAILLRLKRHILYVVQFLFHNISQDLLIRPYN
ncbi:uncharacterized protein LOC122930980 [Bufo gargarizans]|uniref:uncharacterized protein LOC122930980 n=1 Tax=Bufo gargarizans TaxID=30331 RepID=UPI001CF2B5B5|nr:uncharacterized protein LOC122930980 [Bufo gargarizans]